MKKLILTAFAAAAMAAPALAETSLDFVTDGHRIVATVSQDGATQIIKGRDLTNGDTIELHVSNGYVKGDIGNRYVSFAAPKPKLKAANAG